MNEPRHIWTTGSGLTGIHIEVTPDYPGAKRRTLTEGEEWDALIVRVRTALATPNYTNAMLKADALRDLLDYFGETP